MTIPSAPTLELPGPSLIQVIRGVQRDGFLNYIGQLWHQHGDFFQLKMAGRQLIFAMHPDAVRHVNVEQRQHYDKAASYDGVRRYLLGNGLVVSTGELWRRQRKLMAPFYTPRGVQTYAELMLRDGQRLVERWEQLAAQGQPVEISEEMTTVTASIILQAMFSMQASSDILRLKDAVETMISFVGDRQGPLPALPTWVPTRRNRHYLQSRELVHRYISGLIATRRATPQDDWPDDLLTRLMQARDEDGASMDEELLRDESITTFFAGHETTARTMTFAWYALAANPHVLETLHAELDRVLGDQMPTVAALHELPYTLAVIKEALRLYPAAPFYIRDVVQPDTLMGHPLPVGASVMLSPYYTHRHPDFWPDPERFDPERWTPEREAARHPYAYHPFAAGQRICIGNNFSLLESHLLLALLAQRFRPRLLTGFQPQWMMAGTLGTQNGMPMFIERR